MWTLKKCVIYLLSAVRYLYIIFQKIMFLVAMHEFMYLELHFKESKIYSKYY